MPPHSATSPASDSQRPRITAVYPGTFDPITRGHELLMQRASRLFDTLLVAVASGHHKKTLFSLDERLALVRQSAAALPNVQVTAYDGLIRDVVVARGAQVMVRGVRSTTDFDYEVQLAGMNSKLMPEVETILLTPCDTYRHVSSTYVREIATLGRAGEVDAFVSPHVAQALRSKLEASTLS